MFRCPICGNSMREKEGTSGKVTCCPDCGIETVPGKYELRVTPEASAYTKEIYSFLDIVIKERPYLVMSETPLFSTDFSLSKCYSIQGHEKFSRVRSDSLKHLIAHKNFIASHLTKYVYNCMGIDGVRSPLSEYHTYTSPGEVMFEQMLLDKTCITDERKKHLLYAYLSPSMESIISSTTDVKIGTAYEVNDEQALFVSAFLPPDSNIGWSGNLDKLEANIHRFIHEMLSDLDIYSNPTGEFNPEMLTLVHDFILSSPATMMNYANKNEVCYFDITSYSDCRITIDTLGDVENEDDTYKDIIEYNKFIVDKLFGDKFGELYSLKNKYTYLSRRDIGVCANPTDMVIQFWKTVRDEIFTE